MGIALLAAAARAGRRRQEEVTVKRSPEESLRPLVLSDPDGGEVRLGDLWAARPVVLVFIRHFG